MCIRDRDVLAIHLQGVDHFRLEDVVAFDIELNGERRILDGVARGVGDDPVSYTHLRAHETVLDLVCRLLLEKKKKQIADDNSDRNTHHSAQCANLTSTI